MADCRHGTIGWCALCAHEMSVEMAALSHPKVKSKIEALREQLKQANLGRERALNSHRYVEGRLYAAQTTIASQREWIKSAGHRPGCAALSCVAYSGLCGLHEKNDFHCGGLPEHDHKFQPGPCGCGWAEHVEEKS